MRAAVDLDACRFVGCTRRVREPVAHDDRRRQVCRAHYLELAGHVTRLADPADVARWARPFVLLEVAPDPVALVARMRRAAVADAFAGEPVPADTFDRLRPVTLDRLPDTTLVTADLARRLVARYLADGATPGQVADAAGLARAAGTWPADDVAAVALGAVRGLEAAIATGPPDPNVATCERCGAPALAGGRWCHPCLYAATDADRRRRHRHHQAALRPHHRRMRRQVPA